MKLVIDAKNTFNDIVFNLKKEGGRLIIDTSFEDRDFYNKKIFYDLISKVEKEFKLNTVLLTMNHRLVDRKKILYKNYSWSLYEPIKPITFGNKYDFTYLCGFPRKDKLYMLSELNKYSLLDDALWSCGNLNDIKFSTKGLDLPDLPKIIDYDKSIKSVPACWNSINVDLYKDSRFSLVQETEMSEYTNRYTEKTYKCIVIKHPFIVAGNYGVLKELRREGFQTFHPFIDESYDNIKNRDERIAAIIRQIFKLCYKDDQEWKTFLKKINPILEHNHKKYLDLYSKFKKN